jgi:hypothetical protein
MGMAELGKLGVRGMALVAIVLIAALVPMPNAGAVTYEEAPPFCRETTVRDYLSPFRRMPKLHEPTESGSIGFASPSLILKTYAPLVVGEGTVGYSLALRFGSEPVSAQWDIATTLSRVDRVGRVMEVLMRSERRVGTIGSGRGAGIKFSVGGDPAFYKVTVRFRDWAGHRLGGYGFYARVVAPTQDARLRLNANTFRLGETVWERVENFGTTTATYGVGYSIERRSGSRWTLAPESPRGPVPAIMLFSLPGKTGHSSCSGFRIPPTMPPGRYRMAREVAFQAPRPIAPDSTPQRTLYAEFDVIP